MVLNPITKEAAHPTTTALNRPAKNRLKLAANWLFGIAVFGQFLFAYYVIAFYGGIAWSGDHETLNRQLPHGLIEGDTMGNAMLAIHLFFAAIVMIGGPLQFIPYVRKRFPTFHRLNGRIYFVVAFLVTGAGAYMIATRGAHGGWIMAFGNFLNATLIFWFSIRAWQTARQREFAAHKRWALRAFLMISGVWFFRMGYGIWLLFTGFTAPGSEAMLTGPFDRFLGIGHSLVPLLIIELYFLARQSTNLRAKKAMTVFLFFLCFVLAGGLGTVFAIFWLPLL